MTGVDDLVTAMQRWMDAYIHRSMSSSIRHLKCQGLSMSHFSTLMRLAHGGPCGVSDLAEHLGITSAAASQLVEKMVQLGYVTRNEAVHDRRLKKIMLTDAGRALLAENIRVRDQWMNDLSAVLTPAERQQVAEALKLMTDKSGQLGENPVDPCP